MTSNVNSPDSAGRPAYRAAGRLRDRLQELLSLSLAQADAFHRGDQEALLKLLSRKDVLLENLNESMQEAGRWDWDLHRPESFPRDVACAKILSEAADLSRRLQAHERHIMGKLMAASEQIGNRLNNVARKRRAAVGYRISCEGGEMLNAVR